MHLCRGQQVMTDRRVTVTLENFEKSSPTLAVEGSSFPGREDCLPRFGTHLSLQVAGLLTAKRAIEKRISDVCPPMMQPVVGCREEYAEFGVSFKFDFRNEE